MATKKENSSEHLWLEITVNLKFTHYDESILKPQLLIPKYKLIDRTTSIEKFNLKKLK